MGATIMLKATHVVVAAVSMVPIFPPDVFLSSKMMDVPQHHHHLSGGGGGL